MAVYVTGVVAMCALGIRIEAIDVLLTLLSFMIILITNWIKSGYVAGIVSALPIYSIVNVVCSLGSVSRLIATLSRIRFMTVFNLIFWIAINILNRIISKGKNNFARAIGRDRLMLVQRVPITIFAVGRIIQYVDYNIGASISIISVFPFISFINYLNKAIKDFEEGIRSARGSLVQSLMNFIIFNTLWWLMYDK